MKRTTVYKFEKFEIDAAVSTLEKAGLISAEKLDDARTALADLAIEKLTSKPKKKKKQKAKSPYKAKMLVELNDGRVAQVVRGGRNNVRVMTDDSEEEVVAASEIKGEYVKVAPEQPIEPDTVKKKRKKKKHAQELKEQEA